MMQTSWSGIIGITASDQREAREQDARYQCGPTSSSRGSPVPPIVGFGHVTVSPRESPPAAEQRYAFRVPTERSTPTVRIEADFPSEVFVTEIDTKDGWRIESTRAADGRILSAVWSGGTIPPAATAEFTFVARNPADATVLAWKVIQVHEDGSRAEWTGEQGSRTRRRPPQLPLATHANVSGRNRGYRVAAEQLSNAAATGAAHASTTHKASSSRMAVLVRSNADSM